MFQNILESIKININTVRSIIKTNDKLMNILFSSSAGIKTEISEETKLILNTALPEIPKLREWRIYEHCAAVTRLYAIYENFVEELISNWLIILPDLYPQYSDLEETIRENHQEGVGKLLIELKKKKSRYEHLSPEKVMQGLFYGTTGEKKYELLPDAFLIQEQNLRRDTKESLGQIREVGKITEWFKTPDAGVAVVEEIKLSVGNQLFLVNEKTSCCYLVAINSIQIDGKPVNDVQTTTGMEVGLKFDLSAKKGLRLFQLKVE
ncbi:MAG TPA: MAE_28990/MAE_18760 family HEPN-like nuclease [Leptolyngbyaceae cyanobacterium]